jgi:mannosyltransferase
MSSPPAVSLDRRPGGESSAVSLRALRLLRRRSPELAALALTLGVGLWGIGGPSLWWDEMATVEVASRRSIPDMFRVLGHVDAVHAFYYLLMHGLTRLLGTGPVGLRLPSALAMSLAAAGLVVLGRRLGSMTMGLYAGLVFAMMPIVARYSQEARSYGMVTALAVFATVAFVVALQSGRRRWFGWYGLLVAVLGLLHLLALLLVLAHAVTLVLSGTGRERRRNWLVAVGGALVVVSPMLVIGFGQREQLAWVVRPHLVDVLDLSANLCGSYPLVAPVSALIGAALVGARAGGLLRGVTPMTVALPIALLPSALMLAATPFHPLYVYRYGLYSCAGVALLAGAGLARLHWSRALPCLLLIGALAIPDMNTQHKEAARADDPEAAARVFAREVRPGDAILYVPTQTRLFIGSFPRQAGLLNDIALTRQPWQAGNLGGTEVGDAALAQRIEAESVHRVWIYYEPWLDGTPGRNKAALDDRISVLRRLGFRLTGIRNPTGITLGIWDRP